MKQKIRKNRWYSCSSLFFYKGACILLGLMQLPFASEARYIVEVLGALPISASRYISNDSYALSHEGFFITTNGRDAVWIDKTKVDLRLPDHHMRLGDLKLCKNGRLIAGITSSLGRYYVVMWKLEDVLQGETIAKSISLPYPFHHETNTHPHVKQISPEGNYIQVAFGRQPVLILENYGIKDIPLLSGETNPEILSLKFDPYLLCRTVINNEAKDFLLGQDGERRTLPISYHTEVVTGTPEKLCINSGESTTYLNWDPYSRSYKRVDPHFPTRFKSSDEACLTERVICDRGRSTLYLIHKKISSGTQPLLVHTQEELPRNEGWAELSPGMSSQGWGVNNRIFVHPLGVEGTVCLIITKNLLGNQEFYLLDTRHPTALLSCSKWLESLKVKDAREELLDLLYVGPGDRVMSGTYAALLEGRHYVEGIPTKLRRVVKIHFEKHIQELLQDANYVSYQEVVPNSATRDGVFVAGTCYKRNSLEPISVLWEQKEESMEGIEWRAISEDGKYLVGNVVNPILEAEEKNISSAGETLTSVEQTFQRVGLFKTPVAFYQLNPIPGASACEVFGMHPLEPIVVGESTFFTPKEVALQSETLTILEPRVQACKWILAASSKDIQEARPLETPKDCRYSTARAVAEDQTLIAGQLEVPLSNAPTMSHLSACYWSRGKIMYLPHLDSSKHNYSIANHIARINNNIVVVGQSGYLSGMNIEGHAVCWINGIPFSLESLTNLPESEISNQPSAALWIAREKGWIVGVYGGAYHRKLDTLDGHAFIWCDPERGMQDLSQWLVENYKNFEKQLEGWTLNRVHWISPDGLIMLGVGTYRGQRKAFLVDLSNARAKIELLANQSNPSALKTLKARKRGRTDPLNTLEAFVKYEP